MGLEDGLSDGRRVGEGEGFRGRVEGFGVGFFVNTVGDAVGGLDG